MLNHISIGVRDISESKRFYDHALKALGYKCLSSAEQSVGYGGAVAAFWIYASTKPVGSDPNSALHFCFDAQSRKSVDAFHEASLAQGGRDNGKPGLRSDYGEGYYAAFVLDPDGYRLEAYFQD